MDSVQRLAMENHHSMGNNNVNGNPQADNIELYSENELKELSKSYASMFPRGESNISQYALSYVSNIPTPWHRAHLRKSSAFAFP